MEFKITEEVKNFFSACEIIRQAVMIGLITGEPGVGKTRTARKYAEENRNSTYICLLPFSEKTGNLMTQLGEAIGSYYNNKSYPTYKNLKYCLNSYKFLLIDEADFLTQRGLDIIRLLHDETKCPIMLIGSNHLLARVNDKRLLQLKSRIGHFEMMERLSFIELQKILPEMDLRYIKFIYKRTQGNFRLIDRLMNQVNRMVELNKLPKPNKEIIEEAARLVRIG